MANSRDLVRSDTLFAPPFGFGSILLSAAELAGELRHFDGAEAGFKALVATLEACAIDGLLERVAGEDAEHDRDAGIHLRELQAARGFRADIIIMCRLATEDAADGDEGVVTAGDGKFFQGQRKFERARYVHDVHILASRAASLQSVHGALQKALGDEAVEAADDDAEAQAAGSESSVYS